LVPYLDRTFREVRAWTERARTLTDQLERPEPPPDAARLRADRDGLLAKIREELQKLEDLGVEVKSIDGLVDFRALLGDREVYLCWHYGEDAVTFWHELETGFAGRQPIDSLTVFEPTYLS
jgi:hypothetical protein